MMNQVHRPLQIFSLVQWEDVQQVAVPKARQADSAGWTEGQGGSQTMPVVDPRLMANAIRFLSMDAIERAGEGHPGTPLQFEISHVGPLPIRRAFR